MTSPAAAKKQNQTAYDKTISTITLMQKSLSDAHAKLAALTSTDLWRPKIFELLGISKTHLETLETQSGPPPFAFSDVQSLKKFMAISGYDSGGMDILMDNVKIWIEKNGVDEGTVKDVEQDLAGHQMYWVSEKEAGRLVDIGTILEGVARAAHIRESFGKDIASVKPPLVICPEFKLPVGDQPVFVTGPLDDDNKAKVVSPRGFCDYLLVQGPGYVLMEMSMLGSAGPPKILRRYGQDTSLCIVEGKSTSMFATAGQGQVAMESLTLATEAPRTFRWPYHYVMVTDGFKWKFGVLDVANKKVHFSKALCVGMGISLAELMALITIWVSKYKLNETPYFSLYGSETV